MYTEEYSTYYDYNPTYYYEPTPTYYEYTSTYSDYNAYQLSPPSPPIQPSPIMYRTSKQHDKPTEAGFIVNGIFHV